MSARLSIVTCPSLRPSEMCCKKLLNDGWSTSGSSISLSPLSALFREPVSPQSISEPLRRRCLCLEFLLDGASVCPSSGGESALVDVLEFCARTSARFVSESLHATVSTMSQDCDSGWYTMTSSSSRTLLAKVEFVVDDGKLICGGPIVVSEIAVFGAPSAEEMGT